jgi:type I restriction enzyme M protein
MPKRHGTQKSATSVIARVEELVLAASGADAFELVFALAAEACTGLPIARLRARHPDLGVEPIPAGVPKEVLAAARALVERAVAGDRAEALDALFEQLVTRVGKGQKGQFFTPRHVVDLATRALALEDGERLVDPACGSGAFLTHASHHADVDARGFDVDRRAVRVAKLLCVAQGKDARAVARLDSLAAGAPLPRDVDVVATNPPFAGEVTLPGYEVAGFGRRAERDAAFLERSLAILRPGGRLAIVLPHNKVSAVGWAPLRRWLVARARILAVVSFPRETFMPHTQQRTVLLFAKKRAVGAVVDRGERVFFGVSERAGKDAAGEPIVKPTADGELPTWRTLDHDFERIARPLGRFLAREGFSA